MFIAGVQLSNREVLTLTALLRSHGCIDIAVRLERAFDENVEHERILPSETERALHVLVACPPELLRLRRSLLFIRTHRVHSRAAQAMNHAAAVIQGTSRTTGNAADLRAAARRLRSGDDSEAGSTVTPGDLGINMACAA